MGRTGWAALVAAWALWACSGADGVSLGDPAGLDSGADGSAAVDSSAVDAAPAVDAAADAKPDALPPPDATEDAGVVADAADSGSDTCALVPRAIACGSSVCGFPSNGCGGVWSCGDHDGGCNISGNAVDHSACGVLQAGQCLYCYLVTNANCTAGTIYSCPIVDDGGNQVDAWIPTGCARAGGTPFACCPQ